MWFIVEAYEVIFINRIRPVKMFISFEVKFSLQFNQISSSTVYFPYFFSFPAKIPTFPDKALPDLPILFRPHQYHESIALRIFLLTCWQSVSRRSCKHRAWVDWPMIIVQWISGQTWLIQLHCDDTTLDPICIHMQPVFEQKVENMKKNTLVTTSTKCL